MSWLWAFIQQTWGIFVEASFYILIGFLAAAAIRRWVSANTIRRLLGKRNFTSVLMASIGGIPLPLCSCSVVPTAIALRKGGASKGATVSFLISTPETSADAIALTYALMDLPMTFFRPIASLFTALFAGLATELFGVKEGEEESEEAASEEAPLPHPDESQKVEMQDTGVVQGVTAPVCECPPEKPVEGAEETRKSFWGAFREVFDDLSHWLVIGLLLSALISTVLPQNLVENYLGQGIVPMLLMLVVSVPLYICASGSTPIAAALVMKGMSPGAALVFLLAGPATNMATLTLVWKFLGRRIVIIYLGSIIFVTLLLGLAVDQYYNTREAPIEMNMATVGGDLVPGWAKTGAAILFIFLLAESIRRTPAPKELKTVGGYLNRGLGTVGLTPRRLAWVFVLMLILFYLLTGVLIVQPGEVGIVKTFGKISASQLESGFHVHWPWPFASGEVCRVDEVRILRIGFTQERDPAGAQVNAAYDDPRFFEGLDRTLFLPMMPNEKEAYYLTGDVNLIEVQSVVHYRVKDAVQFIYHVEEPSRLIQSHLIAILVELIGRDTIDAVYTYRRNAVEAAAQKLLQQRLDEHDTGIELLRVSLVNVHAPPEVHWYFRDLASAREDRTRLIHAAEAELARVVYGASGEASVQVSQASIQHKKEVLESRGQSEAYRLLLDEYEASPEVLRSRMLFEMYEKVLPESRLVFLPPGVKGNFLGFWMSRGEGVGSALQAPSTNRTNVSPGEKPPLEQLLRWQAPGTEQTGNMEFNGEY